MRGEEQLERVVDRLKPRLHFLVQCSGEVAKRVPHGNHRAADGDTEEDLRPEQVQTSGDGKQRFSGAGLPVARYQSNLGIKQRVEQALLPQVQRLQMHAPGVEQCWRKIQPAAETGSDVPSRHQFILTSRKKDVLVCVQTPSEVFLQLNLPGSGESLQSVWFDPKGALTVALDIGQFDFVAFVILCLQACRQRP